MTRGCLFCREVSGGFASVEHIVPESMGNTTFVLPRGVVCDRCNHGILSDLDNALCGFSPFAMRRTMLGIPSKGGTVPEFRSVQGTMKFIPGVGGADPTLEFRSHSPKNPMLTHTPLPNGKVELSLSLKGGKPMRPKYASQISRALLKVALEAAWLDHGEVMLEQRFDHVRSAVLGEARAGFVAVAGRANPNDAAAGVTYDLIEGSDGWHIGMGLLYAGVLVVTDSRLTGLPSDANGQVEEFTFDR